MKTRVHIVHEYGARRHFQPLEYLSAQGRMDLSYLPPLSRPRMAVRATIRGDWKDALQKFGSLSEWRTLLSARGETFVVGIAPFSPWVFLLEELAKHNRVILFTSWPSWTIGGAVHRPWNWGLAERWWRLLEGLEVVAVTHETGEQLRSLNARVQTIPHSFDPHVFFPGDSVKRLRPRLCFVGRFVPEKGVMEFIESAKGVDADFVVVGDGPLGDEVREEAKGANVTYRGFLDATELSTLLRVSDVLVMPSKRRPGWEELFGIAIIEAFGCGVAALATSHIGPRSIIRHLETGFLIPNEQGLKPAIEHLVSQPKLIEKLKAGALQEAQKYRVETVAECWAEVLLD